MMQITRILRCGSYTATFAALAMGLLTALPAGESETAVDLHTPPTNDAAEKLRLQVTIARENENPLFLTSPGPLNDLRIQLTIKNIANPMAASGSGATPEAPDQDFGTPMVLKIKPGRSLRDLAQEGVNPEDVLEIRPGHTIPVEEKPVLDEKSSGNAAAVQQYTNADGSKTIPTYKSYEALTRAIGQATDDNALRAALKQFAQDAGLDFEPMGPNMEERPNLITTLPTPDLSSDSQVELYVFRKLSEADQAVWKEQHPDGTPPKMLRVARTSQNLFASSHASGAQEVVDSGKEISATVKESTPFLVNVGHNFKFDREGEYVIVASVLGRRANMSNQIEVKVLPYWKTAVTLEKLDEWINHNRSVGPFEYRRMVYLVHGLDGIGELVYSKRFANGKIVHHEFYRLGRVHPEHENEVEVSVVDANVLKVKFIEARGKKCVAQIDFGYSSPNTSLNLIEK